MSEDAIVMCVTGLAIGILASYQLSRIANALDRLAPPAAGESGKP